MSNIRAVVAGATSRTGSTTMLTDVFKLVESFMEGMVVPLAGPDMDKNAKAIMTSGFMTRFAVLMSGPGGMTDKKMLTFIQNEMRTTFVPNMPGLGLFMKTLLMSDVFEKLGDLIDHMQPNGQTYDGMATVDKIMDFVFDTVVKGVFAKSLPAAKAGEVDFPMIFASPVLKGVANKILKGVINATAAAASTIDNQGLWGSCCAADGKSAAYNSICSGYTPSGSSACSSFSFCKWSSTCPSTTAPAPAQSPTSGGSCCAADGKSAVYHSVCSGYTRYGSSTCSTSSFCKWSSTCSSTTAPAPAPWSTRRRTAEKRNPTVVFMEDMFKYLEGEPRKLLLAAFPDLSFLSGGMMSDADMRTLIQSTIYDDIVAIFDLATTSSSSTTAIFESVEKFM